MCRPFGFAKRACVPKASCLQFSAGSTLAADRSVEVAFSGSLGGGLGVLIYNSCCLEYGYLSIVFLYCLR